MWMESDAINIDGMLRLYRVEGNYNDDGSNSKTLTSAPNGSGGAVNFVSETPYGHVSGSSSRQVIQFGGTGGRLFTDGSGLPSGTNSRTMIGWFKQSTAGVDVPFGYGKAEVGKSFNAYLTNSRIFIDFWAGCESIASSAFNSNQWYHVAYTWDGTNSNLKMYIGGSEFSSATGSCNTPNTAT